MAVTVDFVIPYTLAFCVVDEEVLMLHRKRPPNQYLWNGLGGKIENGETPQENIIRELEEEAGVTVDVSATSYKGIVKWNILDEKRVGGAHLFIFNLEKELKEQVISESDEGELAWKPIRWVSDLANSDLVTNIPYFFPLALTATLPKMYEFNYQGNIQLPEYFTHDLTV